jgi:hypothetical protein
MGKQWYENQDGTLKCFGMPGEWKDYCGQQFHCAQLDYCGDCNEHLRRSCRKISDAPERAGKLKFKTLKVVLSKKELRQE